MPSCEFIIGTAVDALSAVAAIAAVVVALYVCYRADRPDVVVYLEHSIDRTMVELVVANLGKGVARDVRFEGAGKELAQKEFQESFGRSFVRTGIPVLVPGGSRRTTLAAGNGTTTMQDVAATVTISYLRKRAIRGHKRESEEFLLEYKSFVGSVGVRSDFHEMKLGVQKIAKSLDSIAESVKQ